MVLSIEISPVRGKVLHSLPKFSVSCSEESHKHGIVKRSSQGHYQEIYLAQPHLWKFHIWYKDVFALLAPYSFLQNFQQESARTESSSASINPACFSFPGVPLLQDRILRSVFIITYTGSELGWLGTHLFRNETGPIKNCLERRKYSLLFGEKTFCYHCIIRMILFRTMPHCVVRGHQFGIIGQGRKTEKLKKDKSRNLYLPYTLFKKNVFAFFLFFLFSFFY